MWGQPYQRQSHKRKQKSVSSTDDDENLTEKAISKDNKHAPVKYKTQMCKNFSQLGQCPYFQKCKFAHGPHQLQKTQPMVKHFYRTKLCRSFWNKETCSYGSRCQFSHHQKQSFEEKALLILMKQHCSSEAEGESKILTKIL